MYTGASCGTWISPRNQYVAHGAHSWEFWMFTMNPLADGIAGRGRLCAQQLVLTKAGKVVAGNAVPATSTLVSRTTASGLVTDAVPAGDPHKVELVLRDAADNRVALALSTEVYKLYLQDRAGGAVLIDPAPTFVVDGATEGALSVSFTYNVAGASPEAPCEKRGKKALVGDAQRRATRASGRVGSGA
eukprot:1194544-Prorocentrum_minimum.AAC.5